MDGDVKTRLSTEVERADALPRGDIDGARPVARRRPRTVLWLIIVGALLALVLGALYGFNRFKEHAIADFFAHNTPPPAEISAVTATMQSVPDYASGIGSIAAVHQVTVTPEVGGLVTAILFQPGKTVKAGDPLVQINDGPDRGDLANYQAQARYAQATLTRNSILVHKQFVSQDTVDQNQAQLDQARAQIQKTEAIIAQKLIRAPFAGRLGVRQIDLGQYLSPGAPIVTLTDLGELYVNFTLPTTMRAQISVGQSVDVTADAFAGRMFNAKITTIEPQISADTRTMRVQATMANPDDVLLPGMFVNAAVVLPAQPDVVVLPETAVEYTLYGDSVYVIRQEGTDKDGKPLLKAHRTPVKTGARWGGKVAVLSGIKAGDRVVAAGQIKLQDGAAVAISDSPPPAPPAHPTPQ